MRASSSWERSKRSCSPRQMPMYQVPARTPSTMGSTRPCRRSRAMAGSLAPTPGTRMASTPSRSAAALATCTRAPSSWRALRMLTRLPAP